MKIWKGYMHGINLGGWLSCCPFEVEHFKTFITEDDIKNIAAWGLDHVRLPIDYELICDNNSFDGLYYINECINWCTKYGLNIIIVLHKGPGYSSTKPESNHLLFDLDLQSQFINVWKVLASSYGNMKNVAFELLNEVISDNYLWNILVQKTIKRIREITTETKIVIGGTKKNSVDSLSLLNKPMDENIVYTFHFYEPFLFTHQKANWIKEMPNTHMEYPGEIDKYRKTTQKIDAWQIGLNDLGIEKLGVAYMSNLMMKAVNVAHDHNTYLYCGEYGAISLASSQSILNWYHDVNFVFDAFHIGRAAWTYKSMSFGISDNYDLRILNKIISYL
jgi:endoglucanase